MAQKYCTKCGKLLTPGVIYCTGCGTKVKDPNLSQGSPQSFEKNNRYRLICFIFSIIIAVLSAYLGIFIFVQEVSKLFSILGCAFILLVALFFLLLDIISMREAKSKHAGYIIALILLSMSVITLITYLIIACIKFF